MSKVIASSYTALTESALGPGQTVLGSQWGDMVEAGHLFHSRAGCRLQGMTFDPESQTTSASYTQDGTNNDDDLAGWSAIVDPQRLVNDGGTLKWSFELRAFLVDCDLRLTILERDLSTSVTTLTVSETAGTSAWKSGQAFVATSTDDPLYLYAEMRTNDTTAKLWHFDVSAEVYTAVGRIPDFAV